MPSSAMRGNHQPRAASIGLTHRRAHARQILKRRVVGHRGDGDAIAQLNRLARTQREFAPGQRITRQARTAATQVSDSYYRS